MQNFKANHDSASGEINFDQFDGIEHENTASPENSIASEKIHELERSKESSRGQVNTRCSVNSKYTFGIRKTSRTNNDSKEGRGNSSIDYTV